MSSEKIFYKLEREVLEFKDLDKYRIPKERVHDFKTAFNAINRSVKKLTWEKFLFSLMSLFPIINCLRTYKWKEYLKYDFFCGLTVGILLVPQGLAYARLTNLPSVTGLYVSFIVPLIYLIFGTSRNLSLGTFSIISLMVGSVIASDLPQKYADDHLTTLPNGTQITMDLVAAQFIVASTLTFFTGAIQIVLSILRFGFISTLFSQTVTNAFIFGSTCQVLTSQVVYLFGVTINRGCTQGISPLVKTYICMFSNIKSANVSEIITSIVSIVFLLLLRFANKYVERKIHIPIPSELILMVISIGISYGANLNSRFGLRIVGHIPSGLPKPILPDMKLAPDVLVSSFTIALVSYSLTISLVKGLSKKSVSEIPYNGEMFAYGISNVFVSFFHGFSTGSSLSRSALMNHMGRTQLSAIVSSSIILIVLVFAASLFFHLPLSVLSAIIVVALINVFMKVKEVKVISRLSKWSLIVWIFTFAAVVLLDVQYGLIVGVCFCLLNVINKIIRPEYSIIADVGSTCLYEDSDKFTTNFQVENVRIVRFGSPLIYLNSEKFYIESLKILNHMKKSCRSEQKCGVMIIDGKYMTYCDLEGCEVIYKLYEEAMVMGISIFLSNPSVLACESISEYFEKFTSTILIFPSVHDALLTANSMLRDIENVQNSI